MILVNSVLTVRGLISQRVCKDLVIPWAGRGYWAVDAFAANIAAGFIGALATVILVDRAAERRQEENHRRVERVALRQARLPIVHLSELFADMIKAGTLTPPEAIP